MAVRGDFYLINEGYSSKPTRNRFLINHTADAEYLQAILKQIDFNSPVPAINQIIVLEPTWLEIDNNDVYGGFEVTLNLVDKTINITNSDAATYNYEKGDYFEFSGKIDAFAALNLGKASQKESVAENSDSVDGINDFGYRMNSKEVALDKATEEYERYRDSVDGDGLSHDEIAIWVWNRLNLDVYTPVVDPIPFKYDEMRKFLDSKFPDEEEEESLSSEKIYSKKEILEDNRLADIFGYDLRYLGDGDFVIRDSEIAIKEGGVEIPLKIFNTALEMVPNSSLQAVKEELLNSSSDEIEDHYPSFFYDAEDALIANIRAGMRDGGLAIQEDFSLNLNSMFSALQSYVEDKLGFDYTTKTFKEKESVEEIAQMSAGVPTEEVSRRVGEFVNNGMRQIVDMK